MMKQKEREKREVVLKQKVETRAAKRVQKSFRMFAVRKRVVAATKLASTFRGVSQKARYQQERRCAVLLQRNVRLWRRRRQLTALTRFYEMLKTFHRMQEDEAQQRDRRLRTLKDKAERRAVCRIQRAFRSFTTQKRALAAAKLQSVARSWLQQKRYVAARSSVCLLQKTVRIWRRRRQLQALLVFQNMLACYRRMQQEEEERRECEREARLRRLQEKAAYRAAYRIQMVYRVHVYHKRALAATLFQVAFRGFRERQRYIKTRKSAVKVQRSIRCWLARTTFRRALRLHRAAVAIQKCVRGWHSRRGRFSFYALRAQLQRLRVLAACWRLEFWFVSCTTRRRKRRALELRARWTQLRAGILRKRVADANKIACCWRAYCLRRAVLVRIQQKRQLQTAALGVQRWWMQLCWKWAERQKRAEEKRRRELEAMARAMAKKRAVRVLGTWLGRKVVTPYRQRNAHYVAVWKLQAWWRGMLVRLHQSSPEVTQQRKKLATMKLVGQEQHEAVAEAKSGPQRRKIKTQEEKQTEKQQPLTLGARLEVALHMLLHGKRLQDMLFASHTIEMCTRYSRECCGKCVQLQISSTIYAAIRGLNRSRPHVELLHQLLLVLVNLTTYRRSMNSSKAKQMQVAGDVDGRLQVDLRALDTLVDLLHIHRDMHHVFVLSARVLKYYLEALKPQVRANAAVRESWREAEKRLGGLQELLAKKLALYNATASFRSVAPGKSSTSSNLMSKMNPKAAASIMTQLVTLMEAQD
ncbi:hypothetical protein BBJ28_00014165 [Nothophytophthora sp. Chile5]|nr:hypothetical protein BBJ28_00014165 [Nothophytophthora sp. Chile5]